MAVVNGFKTILVDAGCPFIHPEVDDDHVRQLLFSPSPDRNDFLAWVGREILDDPDSTIEALVPELPAFLDATMSPKDQLVHWKMIFRLLSMSLRCRNDPDFNDGLDWAADFQQHLLRGGLGLPWTEDKFSLIPKDLIKEVKVNSSAAATSMTLNDLETIAAECRGRLKQQEQSGDVRKSSTKALEAMEDPEKILEKVKMTMMEFGQVYHDELKPWVDRTPKVETKEAVKTSAEEIRKKVEDLKAASDGRQAIKEAIMSIKDKAQT